jgi:hypothetical protein
MSRQKGPVYITGTANGICYYRMDGKYYARRKSTLSRKRVKRDPRFALTRKYAALLGQASQIAAGVYRLLPRAQKTLALYRAMTGQAMGLLKRGQSETEIREHLQQLTKKAVKTAAEMKPVVRMRAETGGMCVVRTVWRKRGKGLQYRERVGDQRVLSWMVITNESSYQVQMQPPAMYSQ